MAEQFLNIGIFKYRNNSGRFVMALLPLLVQPAELAAKLNHAALLVVDLSKEGIYTQAHVPGAINVDYRRLQRGTPPAPGLLPEPEEIARLFSELGLQANTHVVAYDDEGGTRAARFLWLLDAVGHTGGYSYLNGGIHAWLDEDMPYQVEPATSTASNFPVSQLVIKPQVDREYLQQHYQDEDLVIWDARTVEEYTGERVSAQRGGHIPGAVNYDWTLLVNPDNAYRLKPLDEIRKALAERGIDGSKKIITHCQTHHRSSFSWLTGKILGFDNIAGYPGAWSEWGNNPDTPIVTGNA
jgi:thiosulfate/3-mercaptopyruvate sulfurtransferase